jgi:hypothetical protein
LPPGRHIIFLFLNSTKEVLGLRKSVLTLALCLAALLILVAPAQAGSFRLHLKAPGHHPTVGEKWPIKVTAKKRSGKPVRGKAIYRFLYQGQVVATRSPYPHSRKPYPFRGHFKDVVHWPKRSVGIPLTFRVVVKTKRNGKKHVDYKVRVQS